MKTQTKVSATALAIVVLAFTGLVMNCGGSDKTRQPPPDGGGDTTNNGGQNGDTPSPPGDDTPPDGGTPDGGNGSVDPGNGGNNGGLPPPGPTALPHPLYGVTVDSITELDDIVDALGSLSRVPTTRIVFDEFMPATYYAQAVNRIGQVSYVMGELLDSSAMAQYSLDAYAARTAEYLDAFGGEVDIWEIGNEVNGEWLGNPDAVAAKIVAAYQHVEKRGERTALTLYYNEDCWLHPWEEMFLWAQTRIPQDMKDGLDYVLISYYEDDCNGLRPDWPAVFDTLGQMFPKAYIGFGEVGTDVPDLKADYLARYYTMGISQPTFVGGYFWWYFKQDMVPKTKPLWTVLDSIMAAGTIPK